MGLDQSRLCLPNARCSLRLNWGPVVYSAGISGGSTTYFSSVFCPRVQGFPSGPGLGRGCSLVALVVTEQSHSHTFWLSCGQGKQGCIHVNESDEKVNTTPRQKHPDFGLVTGTNPTTQTHKAQATSEENWQISRSLFVFDNMLIYSLIHPEKRRKKQI